MRKLLLSLVVVFPATLFAQYFTEAPKLDRPVKQIIEWQTLPASEGEKEETFKGGVYHFRRDGKLATYQSNDSDAKNYTYSYDRQARLEKVEMEESSGGSQMVYSYSGNTKRAEIKSDSLYLVTTQFMDEKGNVIEEKTSARASFTAGKFSTISRKVLNYNDDGQLFGEMEYEYIGGKTTSRKTVHHFDSQTGKKMKTVFYDENSNVAQTVEYAYSESGKLEAVDTKRPASDYWVKKEFREKNGKPWMEVESFFHEDERVEKVYKDGRLVRIKYFSGGELYFFTDIQYLFY